jgi:addiction module HigA family antidote
MTKASGARQRNPPHPGKVLSDLWMKPVSLTVTAVADSLGVTRKVISKIVNGQAAVTQEVAVRLERAFGASAASWLGHQAAFDLWQGHDCTPIPVGEPRARPMRVGKRSFWAVP